MTDDERFAFLEAQARSSRTGISFDYVPSVEGEPSGWRFMRHQWISPAHKTLRDAIDDAMRAANPVPAF